MEPLVDRTVSFLDVLASPESYHGRVLVLGGEVLKAKRLRDSTQIELLQLPLEDGEEPSLDRQQSQGRFLAFQQEFLDQATVVEGTRVTIVWEVSGAKTDRLDDVEYHYPSLVVKHLHVRATGAHHTGFSRETSGTSETRWESNLSTSRLSRMSRTAHATVRGAGGLFQYPAMLSRCRSIT